MSGLLDEVRNTISDAATTAQNVGKVAAGVISLGVSVVGAKAASALDLDSVREGIAAGIGGTAEKGTATNPLIGKLLNPSALRLAESELTPEQRIQLEKEREQFNRRPGPFDATIWMPRKGEIMKQVEKRAEELTAEARREAEKQVDAKSLAEERAKYQKELKTWELEMGTRLSLIGPTRPVPGPTMMEVERLTGKILEERASKIE